MAWVFLLMSSVLAVSAPRLGGPAAATALAAAEAPAPVVERPEPASDRQRQIDRALEKVLDGRYQKELTHAKDAKLVPGGKDERPRRGGHAAAPPRRLEDHDAEGVGALGSIANLLMWMLLVVAVGLAAVWLIRELGRAKGDASVEGDEEAAPVIDQAVIERPLGDADELARQGRFAEAIHTLLLRTFVELARTRAVRLAPSLTSREILARIPLLADAREALADLITVVEVTHFGDDVPGAPDYERCRDQFNRFAAAYQRGAARAA